MALRCVGLEECLSVSRTVRVMGVNAVNGGEVMCRTHGIVLGSEGTGCFCECILLFCTTLSRVPIQQQGSALLLVGAASDTLGTSGEGEGLVVSITKPVSLSAPVV